MNLHYFLATVVAGMMLIPGLWAQEKKFPMVPKEEEGRYRSALLQQFVIWQEKFHRQFPYERNHHHKFFWLF